MLHKHEVELLPFQTPNYVIVAMPSGRRQDGFKEAPKLALHELSQETLSKMCDQFREDVMRKAGYEVAAPPAGRGE